VIAPDEVAVYHCMNRCVRPAFLCWHDGLTGQSFEHRREWIRARLELLPMTQRQYLELLDWTRRAVREDSTSRRDKRGAIPIWRRSSTGCNDRVTRGSRRSGTSAAGSAALPSAQQAVPPGARPVWPPKPAAVG
jgi:hypothetical protein